MKIANFSICKNILDRLVESTRFRDMSKQALFVGIEYALPTIQKIDGAHQNLMLCFLVFLTLFVEIVKHALFGDL